MEKLKAVVPSGLKGILSESNPEDIPSTCSSLLEFFQPLPLFQKVVRELTDPETALCAKNVATALDFKQKGNEYFSSGDYAKALAFYSQALRFAPMEVDKLDEMLATTIYVNRASSLHKMGLLIEALRDCNRAVVLSPCYAKAWYRRGTANASLQNFEDAISDMTVAMNMEVSLGGKNQIKDKLKIILDQRKRTMRESSSTNLHNDKNLGSCSNTVSTDETCQIKLQCVSTPSKGRGMASLSDIAQASLVHSEEPYAVILLKHCRDNYCHFCLSELPADMVPCTSCSISLYCSQHCQAKAGGKPSGSNSNNYSIPKSVPPDLERYIAKTLAIDSGYALVDANADHFFEHGHECGGAHWPAVLPCEIVLAGRALVKSIVDKGHSKGGSETIESLELLNNYAQMTLERKLETHIYSIILAYCLQQSYGLEFSLTGASISQLVILICQIKVNSMAIVQMKSVDAYGPLEQSRSQPSTKGALTSNIEQIRVGQAIYPAGSLFNHSCQPNVHAYFISRTLFIRTTEFVPAGYPLELSYGPQVGQQEFKVRQQLLEDRYSFKCQCGGCSEMNLSDLVINAFRCAKPNCLGTVLDSCMAKHTQQKIDKLKREDISKVAQLLLEQTNRTFQVDPGYCLNCGSYNDLESSHATAKKAEIYIYRLHNAINSMEVATNTLTDALESLYILRSTLHAYNKDMAEAEDNLAAAYCSIGELHPAMDHSKASIKILEKLYSTNHIVIGNELVKLASIQLSLGDSTVMDSINQLDEIFSLYYGSHSARIFPYLESLKREASKLY
ncbi:PREDICTED: SET and MYND domain-containing protein 4 isoform X2 [Nelumbo nucifera]|uniref:SET and MYND domain-containing protein 4 isoform X2 n=1 Tax=Nelumbo nucifera TaxID=4432 RepID=A0A1U8BFP4_NELNU|nr:PREDICTED: SET and MYND domain-containing protein 4 isoform X2 [Nelumbo nucifera]